ncbi:GNAT family N-acetyltransferase [Bosea sp. 685]|nr:GNAT family N-acetyltransferase [Bosea sp. 685]WNJ89842.1 GNAT family N-acetyltransferase [Bosea sp. 685]
MIETERLLLRPPVLDDFEACYALLSDPAVMSFIGGPMSREESWHRLLRYAGHWSLLGYGLFVIIEKESGRLLGQTGLADFHRGARDEFLLAATAQNLRKMANLMPVRAPTQAA